VGGGRRDGKKREEERKRNEKGEKRPNQAQCMMKIKGQPIQTSKPIDPFCVSNTKFLSTNPNHILAVFFATWRGSIKASE
jgi:hypothetical protein